MSTIESLSTTVPSVSKQSPSSSDVMSDEESAVNICRTKSVGSVRVGASQPSSTTTSSQAKRAIEEKMAALKRQLEEMENGAAEPMDVSTEQKNDVMATPSKSSTSSSTSSSPATASDSPASSTQSSPESDSKEEKPVVDLTSETESTPKSTTKAAAAAKPKQPRKRKAKEPVNSILASFANTPAAAATTTTTPAATAAAAPTDLSIASLADTPLATPEAASAPSSEATISAPTTAVDPSASIASLTESSTASTPAAATTNAVADSSATIKPSPAKKAKTSAAPKESAEEREKRKNEEKARKDAEAAEKKAQKEREKEAEKQKKAQEAAEAKAAKEREKADERAAKQREIDEKKAEKQREIDAKKAEADAKKSELEQKKLEKQQAIEAKKEAKQKEEEAKEAAKKKAEEKKQKQQGFMSSFLGKSVAPAASTAATPTTSSAAAPSASSTATATPVPSTTGAVSTSTTDAPTAAAVAASASASDATASAVAAPVVMSAAARERAERAAALFLPFEAASGRVWSREYSMSVRRGVSSLEREKRGLALMELMLKEAENSSAVPNLIDDSARVAVAKDNGAKRRAKCVSMNDRKKLLQFHDNYRPAWFGRIKKTLTGLMATSQPTDSTAAASASVTPVASAPSKYLPIPRTRRPSARWSVPTEVLNYEVDSEDEWGEEPEDAEELDSDDLDGEDMSDSDAEGEIRGDGLEEDGWLMPEDEDPLAPKNVTDLSGPAQTTKAAGKGKNKVREIMVPVVVGPCMDLDRIVAEYFKRQKAGVDTIAESERVVLTEEMKELMAFKVRAIPTVNASSTSNANVDSVLTAPWQLNSADIMSAYPPWLLPKKEEPVCVKDEPLPATTTTVELKTELVVKSEATESDEKKDVESAKMEITATESSSAVAMECDA